VSTETKSDGQVLSWSAGESIWRATAPATGGGSGSTTLAGLTDTSIIGAASGEYLQHDGSTWFNHAFTQSLDDLSDVEMGAPSNNDVLTYDVALARWKAAAGGGGSGDIPEVIVARDTSPYVAIADFVCSGTNDNIEIKQAINALPSTGGIVRLLAGSYYLSAEVLYATNAVAICGQGYEITKIYRGWNAASGQEMFESTGNYARFEQVSLYGQKAVYTGTNQTGIKITGDYASINGCYFNQFAGYALNLSGSDYSFIYHNIFENWGASSNGSAMTSTTILYAVVAANIFNAGTATGGSAYTGSAKYSSITGNTFKLASGTTGILLNTTSENCSITGNSINGGTTGIDAAGMYHSISGNNILAAGTGISCEGDYSSITGNTVISCTSVGYTSGTGAGNQIFVGNVSYGNPIGFSFVSQGYKILCQGNKIYNSTTYGISITYLSFGLDIIGNQFDTCQIGVRCSYYSSFKGENIVISNNTFRSSADHDILVTGTAFTSIVNNAFIAGSAINAISIDDAVSWDADVYMHGNTFVGAYASQYILESGQAFPPQRFFEMASAGVGIASSSAAACIGFATTETASINHVITVSPAATSNPIATAWDLWSLPSLKENIAPIDEKDVSDSLNDINALKLIKFNWKYQESKLSEKDFESPEAYADYSKRYDSQLLNWNLQKNRVDSWSADILDPEFSDEMASYNNKGEKEGINATAVLWKMVSALQIASKKIDLLEKRILEIESR